MRKNLWLLLFLIFLFIILMARCVGTQFLDNRIKQTPVEIAPYPEKIVELVDVYYGNAENEFLRKEQRAIERTIESREEVVLRELLQGPRNRALASTIPPQTRLYSVSTVNGVSYVNLSKEFVTNFIGGERAEVTAVYSIVNSLTEIRDVKRVQIFVEGERLHQYQKYLSLREPYSRNERIINSPFPGPIEVLKTYFKYIEAKEYRRAYDQIYRPSEYNLDFAMFFFHLTRNKAGLKSLKITTYNMTTTPAGGVIVIDYVEEYEDGNVIINKDIEYQIQNDFGEWRLIYQPL